MYRWRKMDDHERRELLVSRRQRGHPSHSPNRVDSGAGFYLITAACYQHAPLIGSNEQRMEDFSRSLLDVLHQHSEALAAWVVLPNHYHALLHTEAVTELLSALGKLHGRSSFLWNGEDGQRGRQVWCKAVETVMKSQQHFFATINYVLHNPVKHRYVAKWTDWPWSSAAAYLDALGREEAERRWRQYPTQEYGQGWDNAEL